MIAYDMVIIDRQELTRLIIHHNKTNGVFIAIKDPADWRSVSIPQMNWLFIVASIYRLLPVPNVNKPPPLTSLLFLPRYPSVQPAKDPSTL